METDETQSKARPDGARGNGGTGREAESVMVVDDDPAIRELVREYLADMPKPLEVLEASTVAEARALFDESRPDVVLLDMRLPDGDGLDLLARWRGDGTEIVPVIVITADSSSSRTIRAIQGGAWDYLVKPLEPETVQHVVGRALAQRASSAGADALKGVDTEQIIGERIIGSSQAMRSVYKLIGRVAASDVSVLICGETGTGKELVAETIHQNSVRRRGPLVRVNCAALPETLLESELFGHEKGAFTGAVDRRKGRFELADRGTIFLDEVGELEPATQKKLLRVLQLGQFERVGGQATIQVDARVIAATNIDLEAAVGDGRFREDLYYRLNVVRIDLPPLRSRREDIPALAAHFLDRYREPSGAQHKISQAALERLMAHPWPGNVRQLENAIHRAAVLARGPMITVEDLELDAPAPHQATITLDVDALVRAGGTMDAIRAAAEAAAARAALRLEGGDPSAAAARLGVSQARLEILAGTGTGAGGDAGDRNEAPRVAASESRQAGR